MTDTDIDWEAELSTYRRTATKGGGGSDEDVDPKKRGLASTGARASTAPPTRPPPTPPSKAAPVSPQASSPSSGPSSSAPPRPSGGTSVVMPVPATLTRAESAPSPSGHSSGPVSPVVPRPAATILSRAPSAPQQSVTPTASAAPEKSSSGFWKRASASPSASTPVTPKAGAASTDDSDDDEPAPRPAAVDDDEDEKDEAGPSPWIEFKDEKGVKLWYNTKTQATALGAHPPSGAAAAAASKASVAAIDDEDDEDDEDEEGKPRARRGEAMVDEVGDDSAHHSRKKKHQMTPDKILTSLRLIEKQVDLILEHSHTLSPAVCDDLRAIAKSVQSCQKQLETSETVDNRGDVDALIEWNKLPWNFENKHVKGYRAQAARVNHSVFEYKEWHMPQSFSDWPLPPDSKLVTATVKLPIAVDGEVKTAAGGKSETPSSTKIGFSEADTVAKCVQACLAKCKGLPGDAKDYVLKASGLCDYMEGTKLMFAYEYVRMCLRDNIEVKLSLVRRPEPVPEVKESKDDPVAQYMAKVDPSVEVMTADSHRNISGRDAWQEIKSIPLSEVALPFRIRVIGLDRVNQNTLPLLDGSFSHIWLKVFLFHGQQYVQDSIKTTTHMAVCESPRWMTWLMGDYNKETLLNQLPRAVRVGFILFGKKEAEKDKEVMLGWAAHQLIDQWGRLSSGAMDVRLWPVEGKKKKGHGKKRELDPDFIFRQTNRDNNQTKEDAAVLRVKFDEFAVPVVAPLQERYTEPAGVVRQPETPFKSLHKSQQKRIEEIIESDLLFDLSPDDKILIWTMRQHLSKFPSVLPKFLLCVNWGRPEVKNEALRMLAAWAPPVSLVQALELLDAKYPDYTVREYAVNLLRTMKPDELRLYLLQLTQCLKFEPYHDSPLASFLLERALRHPYEIGHHFFWHLKAELHSPYFSERFAVILEEYLSHAGRFARELRKQNQAVLKLEKVAAMIVRLKREHAYSDEDAMREYRKEITKLNSDFFGPQGKFQIPLNPKLEATTLIVEKCRYMSSKMVPLWLVFKNADEDAPPIYIIFKSGDDLRQDILTLQILRVMDKMWLGAGLDMRMKPYRVIATGVNDHGEGVGMIEVVLNSDTTSGIQLQYGGGAMGALKMDPIDLFLHDHQKSPALYEKAVQNFIMSCAGYCVATFVLGIGDRHNGNIMVTKDGHLFHIDFGHFLGNFKKKFGVNRERAAFVFTPEMAFVMGGKKYQKSPLFKKFLHLCSESFKVLRGNAITLENLFVLMVSAGMPELMKEEDIHYMRDKLYLNVKQEAKADKKLHAEINKSLDSTYRRIDNMIHNLKHG